MAKTMTPGAALDIVAVRYPRILSDGFGPRFADEIQAKIWHRFPWRGTIAQLPPFHLILDEQDYGPPIYAVPSDLYGLHQAWINGYGAARPFPLRVVRELPNNLNRVIPDSIAYMDEISSFRVHPRSGLTAPYWWVQGRYKKRPTKIVSTNVNSYLLPWDDTYFEVFRQGLIAKFKHEILGSQDAVMEYRKFLAMIDDMAVAEGLHSGQIVIAPTDSLRM